MSLHVFPDRGTDESEICEKFGAEHHLTLQHSYHGNSFGMLMALKWAYQQSYERVFVVEDDAIVDQTFFSWCRQALGHVTEPFAACGWQYSPDALISDGPDVVIPWYLSVCACLPRKSLFGIVQHAVPEYFSDMGGYLDRVYPNSHRRGTLHYEQDGLILRVCESESRRCIWPRRPRATHIGWRGYHQTEGKELDGTLEERVALVKLALKDPSLLKRLMAGSAPPEMDHCERCQKPLLSSNKAARKICVECFHKDHPDWPITAGSHYYLRPAVL